MTHTIIHINQSPTYTHNYQPLRYTTTHIQILTKTQKINIKTKNNNYQPIYTQHNNNSQPITKTSKKKNTHTNNQSKKKN